MQQKATNPNVANVAPQRPINRHDLVTRHNPTLTSANLYAPLSVGNGEFAFTADVTGLQTFDRYYAQGQPLCTQAQWGWHTNPLPDGLAFKDYRFDEYDTPHGRVGFPLRAKGQEALYAYLRQNPHRLHLGRIGLHLTRRDGSRVSLSDLSAIHQTLDLWSGILYSRFTVDDQMVEVRTACHPQHDQVVFVIDSPLLVLGRLTVEIEFPGALPGPDDTFAPETREDEPMHPDSWSVYITSADWDHPQRHTTARCDGSANHATLLRLLDRDTYFVRLHWNQAAELEHTAAHTYELRPQPRTDRFEVACAFQATPFRQPIPTVADTFAVSAQYWQSFWSTGGAIDLSQSRDARALELERRIVLSQYLTAVHCSGSLPPQETGLMNNSWYGKFHLEMHWWHAIHFPQWGRAHLLERSLWWYQATLPLAKRMAQQRGLTGAWWVKNYGPPGWEACMPSGISPVLIWCQPHPIWYAEMCYRAHPTRETLERYQELVFETAEYMAAFAAWDADTQRYVLAPPIAAAQETYKIETVLNPTFEVAYWRFGLEIAQQWRERAGLPREPQWDRVLRHFAALPVFDGVYIGHERCPETFTNYNRDHPSMLACLGVLPGRDVDPATMRRTLHKVLQEWDLAKKSWGWDYPMIAMTAARLGEPEIAISSLLSPLPQNTFLPNGHNRTRDDLPCYLPANGALLIATAMMACGWEGSPDRHAPGFPNDGNWTIAWEGLQPWL